MSSHDNCTYLKPSIVHFLFELDRCVEHVLHGLNVYAVIEKFQKFVTVLHQNCINNKRDASQKKLREIYDQNSIAYALDDLVDTALYDKINVY